ncbi:MAG: tRNA-dihydrouridine synthase [Deltaproteobacteria bacterium]|nr:tRNA-dihydrouridine synthase [Deltaproteobacteria bacterium]
MVQTFLGFWERLSKPIMALSPMDGVTDFAYRYITALHGKPDVVFTEFTTVEGLFHAPERILQDFEYSEIERPIVAQIYGATPDDFYKATHVVCELGFDGVDINMGCPSKAVVKRNCGAKLITVPDLALEIIRAVRQGIQDWAGGQTLEKLALSQNLCEVVGRMNLKRTGIANPVLKKIIPWSVKTRIGYDSVVIENWVETLLTEQPALISIHGRTLKQMYSGAADWDAIARAAKIIHQTPTLVMGNGDLQTLEEGRRAIENSGVDGVLIGRSAIGNPWVFKNKMPFDIGREVRIKTALEHAIYFKQSRGDKGFRHLNKHLIAYLRHFSDASLLRAAAVRVKNFEELQHILSCTGPSYENKITPS